MRKLLPFILLALVGCVQHDDFHTREDMEAALKACAPSTPTYSWADHDGYKGRIKVECQDGRAITTPVAEPK